MTINKSQQRSSVHRLAAFVAFINGLDSLLRVVMDIVLVLKNSKL